MAVEARDIAVVDQATRRHPRAGDLRLSHNAEQIEVLLRRPLNVNDMLATFGVRDPDSPPASGQLPGFAPALRFVLVQAQPRQFRAERLTAAGWEQIGEAGPLRALVVAGLALYFTTEDAERPEL